MGDGRSSLMVSALVSASSNLGLSPGNPYNEQASHLGVGGGGERGGNIPSHLMLQKLEIP